MQEYGQVLAQLEIVSMAYIIQAFRQLGWEFHPKQQFSTESLIEQSGVVKGYRKLIERLLEILAEEGILQRTGENWEVLNVPESQALEDQIDTLSAQYPTANAEFTLLRQCGSKLAQVLQGTCDPLQFTEIDDILIPATDGGRQSTKTT